MKDLTRWNLNGMTIGQRLKRLMGELGWCRDVIETSPEVLRLIEYLEDVYPHYKDAPRTTTPGRHVMLDNLASTMTPDELDYLLERWRK